MEPTEEQARGAFLESCRQGLRSEARESRGRFVFLLEGLGAQAAKDPDEQVREGAREILKKLGAG